MAGYIGVVYLNFNLGDLSYTEYCHKRFNLRHGG